MIKNILFHLKKLFQIILFLALVPAVFVLVSSRSTIIAGIQSFVVLSGSMEPQIPVGSIILVQKDWPYRVGDAIAFQNSSDTTVTHRIVKKLSQDGVLLYQVKGDANDSADSQLVPENTVLGKELSVIPYLGRAVAYLKTIPGFLIFIILPTIIFIAIELWNIKKEIVAETEKNLLAKMQLASQGETLQGYLQE